MNIEINPYEQARINSWAAEAAILLKRICHLSEEIEDLVNRTPSTLIAVAENDRDEIDRINRLFEKHSGGYS